MAPELPELPELVPVPVPVPVPELVPVPMLPLLVPVPDELPLAPLLPVPISLPPRMAEQPDRASAMASKPARTTLWCCCFMMDPPLIVSVGMRDDDVCHFGKRGKRARRSS